MMWIAHIFCIIELLQLRPVLESGEVLKFVHIGCFILQWVLPLLGFSVRTGSGLVDDGSFACPEAFCCNVSMINLGQGSTRSPRRSACSCH